MMAVCVNGWWGLNPDGKFEDVLGIVDGLQIHMSLNLLIKVRKDLADEDFLV
jgi:hypothetical protein